MVKPYLKVMIIILIFIILGALMNHSKGTIPFLILSIATALLLYYAYRDWRKCMRNNRMAREMTQWPTVSATAKKWNVRLQVGGGSKYLTYITEITYSYSVNNKDYEVDVSEAIFKPDGNHSESKVESAKHKAEAYGSNLLKKKKKIELYYNPKDPSESSYKMLSKSSCIPIFIVVCFVSIFFLVCTLLFFGSMILFFVEKFS